MKRGLLAAPAISLPFVGAIVEGRLAIYAAAAVLIVLIVSFLILALRDIGPIYERGKTTKFRLGPIRDSPKPPPRRK
ncbi:MAG: hypothetical protein ACJ76D_10325 [Solirubrobacterales bacterium]